MRVEELALLRSDDLLHLARNPVANCRQAAIRLLVERGSPLAAHPDIHADAVAIIHSDPLILKKTDPASEISGRKLPGLLDVLAKEVASNRALEQKSSALESNLAETAVGLRGTIAEKESSLKQAHAELSDAVDAQVSALSQKLIDTASKLDSSQRLTAAELERKRESLRDEILLQLSDLVQKYEAYGQRIEKAEARVSRLERPWYRKIWDWLRGR